MPVAIRFHFDRHRRTGGPLYAVQRRIVQAAWSSYHIMVSDEQGTKHEPPMSHGPVGVSFASFASGVTCRPSRNASTSPARRRAITLMELLLVMAVLVAIAALALPSLVGPLETQRLRSGAEMVRVQWARARVKAIETGRTYVFRFEPNGQACLIEPWLTMDDYLESNEIVGLNPQLAGASAMGGMQPINSRPISTRPITTPTTTTATSSIEEVQLPENILFGQYELESAPMSALLSPLGSLPSASGGAANFGSGASGMEPSTVGWETIFFYPDGTSTSARLMVLSQRGKLMVLSLRGLTGVVTVSDVKSVAEL